MIPRTQTVGPDSRGSERQQHSLLKVSRTGKDNDRLMETLAFFPFEGNLKYNLSITSPFYRSLKSRSK